MLGLKMDRKYEHGVQPLPPFLSLQCHPLCDHRHSGDATICPAAEDPSCHPHHPACLLRGIAPADRRNPRAPPAAFVVLLAVPVKVHTHIEDKDIPESFNAYERWPGFCHPIRDQAHCGSCWAFAASVSNPIRRVALLYCCCLLPSPRVRDCKTRRTTAGPRFSRERPKGPRRTLFTMHRPDAPSWPATGGSFGPLRYCHQRHHQRGPEPRGHGELRYHRCATPPQRLTSPPPPNAHTHKRTHTISSRTGMPRPSPLSTGEGCHVA